MVNVTWNVANGWNMWEPFYREKLDGVRVATCQRHAPFCYFAELMSCSAGNEDGFVCKGSVERLESLVWC